jgi:hypothetical protein
VTGADLDRERLARVLGLLGSTYDGEIAAAGRQADGLVRRASMTWFDVVLPPAPLAPIIIQPPVWREPQNTKEAIAACLAFPQALDEWDRDFLRSIARWRGHLTPEQTAVLQRLLDSARSIAMRGCHP